MSYIRIKYLHITGAMNIGGQKQCLLIYIER